MVFDQTLHFSLLASKGEKITKIERIVSRGHASPEDFWYDQEENEWVMVVKGTARCVAAVMITDTIRYCIRQILHCHFQQCIDIRQIALYCSFLVGCNFPMDVK